MSQAKSESVTASPKVAAGSLGASPAGTANTIQSGQKGTRGARVRSSSGSRSGATQGAQVGSGASAEGSERKNTSEVPRLSGANGRSDPPSLSASSQSSRAHSPKSSPRIRDADAGVGGSGSSGQATRPSAGSASATFSSAAAGSRYTGNDAASMLPAGSYVPGSTMGSFQHNTFPAAYPNAGASSYTSLEPPVFGSYTTHSPILSPSLSATSSPAMQSPSHLASGPITSMSPALIAALTASSATPAEAAAAVASAAAAIHAGFDDKTLAALNSQNQQYAMRTALRTASLPGGLPGPAPNGRSRASTSHQSYVGNAGARSYSIASQRSSQPHFSYGGTQPQHYGYGGMSSSSSASGGYDRGHSAKFGNNSTVRSSSAYSSFPSERFTAELSNCIIAFLSPILPTEEEYRIKEATRRQLERLACKVSPGAKLLAFGSMANGFALKNSDMDLCCLINPETTETSDSNIAPPTVANKETDTGERVAERPSEVLAGLVEDNLESKGDQAIGSSNTDKGAEAGTSHEEAAQSGAVPGSKPVSARSSLTPSQTDSSGQAEPQRSASELVTILGQLIREETDFNVMPLPKARIPIIKISRAPTAEVPYEISCDIGFENRLALENTRLLLSYAMVDPPRLRTLVLFLKVWTKRRKLNSPYTGTLSSYGYTLLALYFLIHVRKPAVLPNLQRILPTRPLGARKVELNGHNIYFYDDVAALRKEWSSQNTENVGELLIDFFKYFSKEFAYSKDVISIRTETGTLFKDGQVWNAELCIEDPFQLGYNVSRTVTKDGLYTIRGEFMRATRILVNKGARVSAALAELCEEREDIINCAPNGHTPRRYAPPHSAYPRGDTRVYRDLYDVPNPRRHDGSGLAGSFAFEEMARNLGQVQRNLMSYPPTAAMLAPLSHNNGLSPRPAQNQHLMPGRRHSPKNTVHMSSTQSESGSTSQAPDHLATSVPTLQLGAGPLAASARSSPSLAHAVPSGLIPSAGVGEAFAYGSEISFGSERFRLHPHSHNLVLPIAQGEMGGPRTSRSQSESMSRSKSLPQARDTFLNLSTSRRASEANSGGSQEAEGDASAGADGSALDASDEGEPSSLDSQQQAWLNGQHSTRGRPSSSSQVSSDSFAQNNYQPFYGTPQAPWTFMQPGAAQQMAAQMNYYNMQLASLQHGAGRGYSGAPYMDYGAGFGTMRGFGSRSLPDASMYAGPLSTAGSHLDSDHEGWRAGEEEDGEGEDTGFSSPSEGTLDELARISQVHQEAMSPPFAAPFGWSPQSTAAAPDSQLPDAAAVPPRLDAETMGGGSAVSEAASPPLASGKQ